MNILRKTLSAMALAAASLAIAQTPMIKFHTRVIEETGNNTFHFLIGASSNTYIDVDCGFGPMEEEVQAAVYDPDTQEVNATTVSCTVSSAGWVTINGDDATLIDYLDLEGCYIDQIQFPSLVNLSILNMDHNMLAALDLTGKTKLQSLSLSDNPFNGVPLSIPPMPQLSILAVSMIDNISPSFDLTGFPSLASFEAYGSKSITHLDPSNCPNLLRLSADMTNISTLDITKNPSLLILNIAETRVTSIDLSHNPYLTEFYCGHVGSFNNSYKIAALDISKNPELVRFYCDGNSLTTLDISNNPKLVSFGCSRNLLQGISFDANPALYTVDIRKNLMDFVTIPADRSTFSEYYYDQMPFPTERSYPVGTVLDFSDRVNRPNSTTDAVMYSFSELGDTAALLDPSYYTYDNGKITLLKETGDSVFVAFANSALRDAVLTTGRFLVKSTDTYGKSNPVVQLRFSSTVKDLAMSVGISGATPQSPKTFYIDYGDGQLQEYKATGETLADATAVTGQRAGAQTIVYLPEGDDITAFGCTQGRLLGSDFSGAVTLRELKINGVQMSKIDLLWNRCLQSLDLSDNNLTRVNLDGANGSYGKNVLSTINLSNNRIDSIGLNDHRSIISLDLSGNQLTEIPMYSMNNLVSLNVADNMLTEIDLNDCESLTYINASHNLLTSLPVPSYTPLHDVDVTFNNFTFASLAPAGSYAVYKYAPQNIVELPAKAPGVNLSAYNFVKNGTPTRFTWKTATDGRELTSSEIQNRDGRFQFLDPTIGAIYCEITHAAFPDFTGDDVLKTTNVITADKPTHVFATFTTADASDGTITLTATRNNEVIYIDWTGQGDLDQYILKSSYTKYDVSAPASTVVKCYSYDEADNVTVFSLHDIALASMDASPMKQLTTFACSGSGLNDGTLQLPASTGLKELAVDGNNFTTVDFSAYTLLDYVTVTANPLKNLDLTYLKSLGNLIAANCSLTDVKLAGNNLWNLDLSSNRLETVDLSGMPNLQQLWLNNNNLTSVDVSMLSRLNVLFLDGNRLDFNTLPPVRDSYYVYYYINQQPVEAEVKDNSTIDLSHLYDINGTVSTFTWYLDSPFYNEDGTLTGEDLYVGEEYLFENGVSTFIRPFNHIMCVIENALFPGLYLYTDFINVLPAGIDDVTTDDCVNSHKTEYYNLQGIRVENPVAGHIYIMKQGTKTTKAYKTN